MHGILFDPSIKDLFLNNVKDYSSLFVWGIIVLGTLVQVSPIKLNPWSWLKKKVQDFIGVKALSDKMDLENAHQYRTQILRYGDDIAEGRNFSQKYYESIIEVCDAYDKYCETHSEFKNGVTAEHEALIRESYALKLKNKGFKKII